jgi:hypothetical protein
MKYDVEIGSGAMIFIPSFIKTGSTIRKFIGWTHTHTHRQQSDFISLVLFIC